MSSDMSPEREILGQRVREALREVGLSQAEMARQSGVNQSFISQVCRGASLPSVHLLQALGRSGVSLHWLLLGDGPMLCRDMPVQLGNESAQRPRRPPIFELAEQAVAIGGEVLANIEGYMRGRLAAQDQQPQRARAG